MKRSIAFLLAIAAALSLAGCDGSTVESAQTTAAPETTEVQTTGAPSTAATETETVVTGGCAEDYGELVASFSQEYDGLQFALIYLDEDDTPELVADMVGNWISLYTWSDGAVYQLMDQWPYGVAGNNGYEYVPKQNIIRNYNYDQAGAIVHESYYSVGDDLQLSSVYGDGEELSAWYFTDSNGNGMIDEDEDYSSDPVAYYRGTQAVTAEEYASYQILGDYEFITGTESAQELLEQF